MNQEQHYYGKLAEESLEVLEELQFITGRIAKRALKTQQFGGDEKEPGQLQTNKERLHKEINDFNGVIKKLNRDFKFGSVPDDNEIDAKIKKMEKYTGYSQLLGLVEQD